MTDTEMAIDAIHHRLVALESRDGGMTLTALEAVAVRLGTAVATIREAQALLGVAPGSSPSPSARRDEGGGDGAVAVAPPNSIRPAMSPAETRQRAEMMRQFRQPVDPGLPEEIAAMERE
jgi:hypothetical protein